MIQAILRHHRLTSEGVHRAPKEGVANEVWLGPSFVVRIAKDPEYLSDFFTEAVAASVAFAAGILTPRPHLHDASHQVVPAEYSIFDRAPGERLADCVHLNDPHALFFSFGAELRKLHQISAVPDPTGALDPAWIVTPESLLTDNPNTPHASLIRQIPFRPAPALAFTHMDLHAENVLVADHQLSAILDWGDAGWGDPAADFRYLPARFLPEALAGYGPTPDDPGLWHRIVLHQVDQRLYADAENLDYGPYGSSTWSEIIALLETQNHPRGETPRG